MTSHRTVAKRIAARGIAISEGTVRKARRVLRSLGFQVTVEQGRYLTKTERLAYALGHPQKDGQSGKQYVPWRKASTRVFTMTADVVRGTGHLPRRGYLTPTLKKVSTHQKSVRSGFTAPSPKKPRSKAGRTHAPRPLGMQKLAARLKRRMGWLAGIHHNNTICDILMRLGVDESKWTAESLITALNQRSSERGWKTPESVSNAAGYLSYIVRDLNPQALAHSRSMDSRASQATQASQDAKAKLDYQASSQHRNQVLSNVAKLRAALRGPGLSGLTQTVLSPVGTLRRQEDK